MRQRRLKAEINVVPYIDVMLVLLVIFMVTAPMMTTGTIELPTVSKAQQTVAPIEIRIKADQSLSIHDQSRKSTERLVSRTEMVSFVKAAQAKNPDQPVVIAGDKAVRYEAVLGVMDELQRAQVKRVGLLVQPSGR